MIIPHNQLSPDTLRGLIEEFITRDGTDYGEHEVTLDQKMQQIQRQMARGDIVIVFDPATESVSLLTRRDAEILTNN